jgi:hypothetical protein
MDSGLAWRAAAAAAVRRRSRSGRRGGSATSELVRATRAEEPDWDDDPRLDALPASNRLVIYGTDAVEPQRDGGDRQHRRGHVP